MVKLYILSYIGYNLIHGHNQVFIYKEGHMTKETAITSLKDAGYQGCISSERGLTIGKFIYGKCPSYLDSVPDEIKAELESGQMLRFHENNPVEFYNAKWVPCDAKAEGATKVDIQIVMAMSQQAFGAIRVDEPIKHGIYKEWRDDWSNYKTNRNSDLRKYVKEYIDNLNGKKRERAVTKSFAVWLKEDILKSIKARAVTAKAKGDTTVDDAVVALIVKAIK